MTARKCQGAKKALTRLIELPKFCHEDAASGKYISAGCKV